MLSDCFTRDTTKIILLLLLIGVGYPPFLSISVGKFCRGFSLWLYENLGLWGLPVVIVVFMPLHFLLYPAGLYKIIGNLRFCGAADVGPDSLGAVIAVWGLIFLGRTMDKRFHKWGQSVLGGGWKATILLNCMFFLPVFWGIWKSCGCSQSSSGA